MKADLPANGLQTLTASPKIYTHLPYCTARKITLLIPGSGLLLTELPDCSLDRSEVADVLPCVRARGDTRSCIAEPGSKCVTSLAAQCGKIQANNCSYQLVSLQNL